MARAATASGAAAPTDSAEGVSGDVLARFWKCSEAQVRAYYKEGVAIRLKTGRYALMESTQNLIVLQRAQIHKRLGPDGDISAVTESAKLKISQRALVDMRVAERTGRLLPVEEIEEAWGALVIATRAMILALPGRIRFDLPHLSLDDRARIEAICRTALSEAAVSGPRPQL